MRRICNVLDAVLLHSMFTEATVVRIPARIWLRLEMDFELSFLEQKKKLEPTRRSSRGLSAAHLPASS